MPTYRLYLLDEFNHIVSGETADCDYDGDAIAAAEARRAAHPWLEVWCGDRVVWRCGPPGIDDRKKTRTADSEKD